MKFFLVFFINIVSLDLYANEQNYLLSSEQFNSLTREQQAKYLKKVQQILADMTKRSLYMAGNESLADFRMPAADVVIGSDIETAIDNIMKPQQKPRTETADKTVAKLPPTPPRREETPSQPESPPTPTVPLPSQQAAPATLPNPLASLGCKRRKDKTFYCDPKNGVGLVISGSGDDARYTYSKNGRSIVLDKNYNVVSQTPAPSPATSDKPSATSPPAAATAVQPTSVSSQSQSATPRADSSPTATTPPPAPRVAAPPSHGRRAFRCMYSGWVVKTDPCAPQTSFPADYKLNGIDSGKMKCPNGKTMCNPTLFGLVVPKECKKLSDCISNATPICVPTGAWPTVDCFNASTPQFTLMAADLIKDNSAVWDQYNKDFADLCNEEKINSNPFAEAHNQRNNKATAKAIRDDIRKTCKFAQNQLNIVNEATALTLETRGDWINKPKTKAVKPGQK